MKKYHSAILALSITTSAFALAGMSGCSDDSEDLGPGSAGSAGSSAGGTTGGAGQSFGGSSSGGTAGSGEGGSSGSGGSGGSGEGGSGGTSAGGTSGSGGQGTSGGGQAGTAGEGGKAGAGAGGAAAGAGGATAGAGGAAAGAGGANAGAGGAAAGAAGANAGSGGANAGTGGAPAQGFCQSHGSYLFCDDFDTAGALTQGTTQWDSITSMNGNVSLSTTHAVSLPNGLWINQQGNDAKLRKTITHVANEVVFEYDMFVDALPPGGGALLTDFQLTPNDSYGFRVQMIADANGGYQSSRLEHNAPALNIPDTTYDFKLPATGAWVHFKLDVKFSAGAGDPALGNATFDFYVGDAATPVAHDMVPAPFPAATTMTMQPGVSFAFQGDHIWGLYFDNITLDVK